jgi:hypothetical protein
MIPAALSACSHESHDAIKELPVSEFRQRVLNPREWNLDGDLLLIGECPECNSTLSTPLNECECGGDRGAWVDYEEYNGFTRSVWVACECAGVGQ